jgi:DMSO/TMAO reductase YedYZ molybdopterin-dependent catalytic subunit
MLRDGLIQEVRVAMAEDDAAVCVVVEGLVQRRMVLTWADILDLPAVTFGEEAEGEGRGIGARRWAGPLVTTLLALAGPLPEATHVRFEAGDYRVALPLPEEKGALLAHTGNGERVTGDGPRLVAPRRPLPYQVKGVTRLELAVGPGDETGIALVRQRQQARAAARRAARDAEGLGDAPDNV